MSRWTTKPSSRQRDTRIVRELEISLAEGGGIDDCGLAARPGSCRAHRGVCVQPSAGPSEPLRELTIRFVAIDEGEVTGDLDAYRDPDCDCRAYTRFRGRLDGSVIEGTFVTHTARGDGPVHGTWRVTRKLP